MRTSATHLCAMSSEPLSSHTILYRTPGSTSCPQSKPHLASTQPRTLMNPTWYSTRHCIPPSTVFHPALYPTRHSIPPARYSTRHSIPPRTGFTRLQVRDDRRDIVLEQREPLARDERQAHVRIGLGERPLDDIPGTYDARQAPCDARPRPMIGRPTWHAGHRRRSVGTSPISVH